VEVGGERGWLRLREGDASASLLLNIASEHEDLRGKATLRTGETFYLTPEGRRELNPHLQRTLREAEVTPSPQLWLYFLSELRERLRKIV